MVKKSKYRFVILANELEKDHRLWEAACNDYKNQIDFRVVNLTSNSWLDDIKSETFDMLLAKPGGITALLKNLYDERLYILVNILNYNVFPSLDEILIYENKRFLSFWLNANNIPHPKTDVFYSNKEATEFINNSGFPIVAKTNIGASGSGVTIIKSRSEALKYLLDIFFGKGAGRRSGPNLKKGNILRRGFHYLLYPKDVGKKLKIYSTISKNPQKGFVIFQEYVRHNFEWRVVRIGDSFFAHKKLIIDEKASGSLLKGYEDPPHRLLDFVKSITDIHKFYSQAIDIFETSSGNYLVNEMQCIFGQSDPYQMLVNGVPGRYRYIDNHWTFEEGTFNKNESFNLRIEWILENLL